SSGGPCSSRTVRARSISPAARCLARWPVPCCTTRRCRARAYASRDVAARRVGPTDPPGRGRRSETRLPRAKARRAFGSTRSLVTPLHLPDLDSLSVFDGRLRQVPADLPALVEAIRLAARQLRRARAVGDLAAELRLHGYVGTAYRIQGRWRAAKIHLRAA